jgi:signal transduction histidine kinase
MKTPLTVVATDIQLAEKYIDEKENENAKALMREAWQETIRLADQITGILAIAHRNTPSGEMGLVDFGALIESVLALFETQAKIQGNAVSRHIEKLPPLWGNTDMLINALFNLLANANYHTKNGSINVTWSPWSPSSQEDGKRYCLAISDSGSGIPPDLLPKVFEPGVSGRNSSGLGLAIVKNIMALHNGEVTIASEYGKGTKACLFFPAYPEQPQ